MSIKNLFKIEHDSDDDSEEYSSDESSYILDEREELIGKSMYDWNYDDWSIISRRGDLLTEEFVDENVDKIVWDNISEDFITKFKPKYNIHICGLYMENHSKEFIIENPGYFCSYDGKDSMTSAISSWSSKSDTVIKKAAKDFVKTIKDNPEALKAFENFKSEIQFCVDGFYTFTIG